MQQLSSTWLYPIIIIAGVLQAWGPPMNGALQKSMVNPWLASLVSFLPIGAGAVVVGLMFVNRVGAGTLAGLTITANLIMSLLVDKYGWFGIQPHQLGMGRIIGIVCMVAGIFLISRS